jgi:transposase
VLADAPDDTGTQDARLRPPRHDQPVRGLRPGQRLGHRPALPPSPPPGVPAVLKLIDAAVPKGLDLHLVLDNYAAHKTPAIKDWLVRHPRFRLHFTPTSSSWLNLAERWFAELTSRKLRRSAHRSVTELETDIRKWINEWNKDPKPFAWTKSADEILETLAAYCQRIAGSGR